MPSKAKHIIMKMNNMYELCKHRRSFMEKGIKFTHITTKHDKIEFIQNSRNIWYRVPSDRRKR